MTTAVVGRRVGYSTQQVRDLERLGVIPVADRSPSGYRQYGSEHVVALLAYRGLAAAIGPVTARTVMPTLLAGSLLDAASTVDGIHASIARERDAVLQARRSLNLIHAEAGDVFDVSRDAMTIAELAEALGVRVSTLRHWEAEGLVRPDRVGAMKVRRYSWRAIGEARVVAALRAGGHRIPTIASVLDRVRAFEDPHAADDLLADRLEQLAARSLALLEASGALHELVSRGRPATSATAG